MHFKYFRIGRYVCVYAVFGNNETYERRGFRLVCRMQIFTHGVQLRHRRNRVSPLECSRKKIIFPRLAFVLIRVSDKGSFDLINMTVYISQFQVIILGSWVFAFVLNIPLFLVVDTEKERDINFCVAIWPEGWMGEVYSWTWLVLAILPLVLMIGLYSRVVYTLWFKRNDDSHLTHQQKVSVLLLIN